MWREHGDDVKSYVDFTKWYIPVNADKTGLNLTLS